MEEKVLQVAGKTNHAARVPEQAAVGDREGKGSGGGGADESERGDLPECKEREQD